MTSTIVPQSKRWANAITNQLLWLKSNRLIRNLGTMGAAQLTIRFSRLFATVMLSRLLLPQDYGLSAIVLTVYEFISLFTRNGIAAKVVQASDAEVEQVANTAYRMTWIFCGGLVAVQLLLAVPIGWLYSDMRVAAPIALMSFIYFATPLCSMQGAFQQREGRLGRFAFASAAQVVVDNLLTAVFALFGLGLWAIILPKILVAPIWVVVVRFGHPWRPQKNLPLLPMQGWKDIARFSRSVLGVELLTTLQANIDNLLVGYFLGIQALGIYYFAFNAGLGITQGLIFAAGIAIYPHLCEVRSQPLALRSRFRQTLRTMSLTMVPLIILQASFAPIYVPIIFGAKWAPAIPVLSLICLSALARPFAATCSQLLKAIGRPEIELRWQLVNTILLIAALLVAAQFSIYWVGFAIFVIQTVFLSVFAIIIPSQVFNSNDAETKNINDKEKEMPTTDKGFDVAETVWR